MSSTAVKRRTGSFERAFVVYGGALVIGCCGVVYWVFFRPNTAAGYASQVASWPHELVKDFPQAIPNGATGVRVQSSGGFGPNHFLAVRFLVPKADVEAMVARARSVQSPPPKGLSIDTDHIALIATWLPVIDDRDPNTPLPPGFEFYLLVAQPENFAYLAANPRTGEVVYWATIH